MQRAKTKAVKEAMKKRKASAQESNMIEIYKAPASNKRSRMRNLPAFNRSKFSTQTENNNGFFSGNLTQNVSISSGKGIDSLQMTSF